MPTLCTIVATSPNMVVQAHTLNRFRHTLHVVNMARHDPLRRPANGHICGIACIRGAWHAVTIMEIFDVQGRAHAWQCTPDGALVLLHLDQHVGGWAPIVRIPRHVVPAFVALALGRPATG